MAPLTWQPFPFLLGAFVAETAHARYSAVPWYPSTTSEGSWTAYVEAYPIGAQRTVHLGRFPFTEAGRLAAVAACEAHFLPY